MFKTFVLVNNTGNDYDMFDQAVPTGTETALRQKICVNLKNIDALQQTGRWVPNPELPRTQVDEFAGPARPVRRTGTARPGATARAAQIFQIDADRFSMVMKNGNQWIVLGNFEEIADILSNFVGNKESVE